VVQPSARQFTCFADLQGGGKTDDYPSDENKEAEIKLLFKVGRCLQIIRQYVNAEQMHQRLLELMKKVSGPKHPYTLVFMNLLACALSGPGQVGRSRADAPADAGAQEEGARIRAPRHVDEHEPAGGDSERPGQGRGG
jgi:hypothetical protein